MSNCTCKNNVAGYTDVSRIESVPWQCAKHLLGRDGCGRILVLDKPLYEISESDREKLDRIVIDGDGDMFLADDGTFKRIEFATDSVVLTFHENPANFVINNQAALSEIWAGRREGREIFVRMHVEPYTLPISYAYGDRTLVLEYDKPLFTPDLTERVRLKLLIGLHTDVYPFNIARYEINKFVDADTILITDGDGSGALFDDGTYKPTYTKEQVDVFVDSLTEDINEGEDAVKGLGIRVTSLEETAADLRSKVSEHTGHISDLDGRVSANTLSIDVLHESTGAAFKELDIDSLFSLVNENENFKGYFLTNSEVTQIAGTSADFAWSAESGTVWVYDASVPSWTDSGLPIPQEAVSFYNGDPLVNGIASPGEAVTVSRGDHVHPSDPTKADVENISTALSQLTNDAGFITASAVSANYVSQETYTTLVERVAALEAVLSGVTGFWAGTQAEYEAIDPKEAGTYYHTYGQ